MILTLPPRRQQHETELVFQATWTRLIYINSWKEDDTEFLRCLNAASKMKLNSYLGQHERSKSCVNSWMVNAGRRHWILPLLPRHAEARRSWTRIESNRYDVKLAYINWTRYQSNRYGVNLAQMKNKNINKHPGAILSTCLEQHTVRTKLKCKLIYVLMETWVKAQI